WHTAADAHEITLSIGTRYTTVRNMISRLLIDYNIELTFATSGDDNELYTGTIGRSPSLPPQLATVMLSVGIGSLRGMMASRTAGSMLARYPLPIINVSELVSRIAYGSMPAANSVPLSGLIYE
ncbi:MAG: hypothetical protein K2L49_01080, partial [Muribaculaceae bacterium]|nr:hypothetical protein [Muribaculaceae bacterium]